MPPEYRGVARKSAGVIWRGRAASTLHARRRRGARETAPGGIERGRGQGDEPTAAATAPALGPAVEPDDLRRVLRGSGGRGGVASRSCALGPVGGQLPTVG